MTDVQKVALEVKPIEFKKILVAIDEDDSESSLRAYSYAVNLARDLGITLGIVSILETNDYNVFEAMTPKHVEKDREEFEMMMNNYVEKAEEFGVKDVKGIVGEGNPGKVIVNKVIPKFGNDLLIVGYKTKKVSEGRFIGSQASYMAKEANCSVTIIK